MEGRRVHFEEGEGAGGRKAADAHVASAQVEKSGIRRTRMSRGQRHPGEVWEPSKTIIFYKEVF